MRMFCRSSGPVLAAVACGAGVAPATRGQCVEQWVPQTGAAGLNGEVLAACVWDPPGPTPDLLVFGGWFSAAGGAPAAHVAAWDGGAWSALGSGTSGDVYAVEVYDGEVVAGGHFGSAGGVACANIASWDGAAWRALGAGLVGPPGSSAVSDLAVHDGALIAAGPMDMAGGTPVESIARWDGAAWQALGTGLPGGLWPVVESVGGELIAGSRDAMFSIPGCGDACRAIARWDGLAWRSLGPGLDPAPVLSGGGVETIVSFGGEVVAGGAFDYEAGSWTRVARFDDAVWHPLAPLPPIANFDEATLLHVHRTRLIAVPGSDTLLNVPLASWDGAAWSIVPGDLRGFVFALATYRGELVAAGMLDPATATEHSWARRACVCYPDCDNSGTLTVSDFGCFQTQFVVGHPYADCNADNTLSVADFGCFQTKFVAGCK